MCGGQLLVVVRSVVPSSNLLTRPLALLYWSAYRTLLRKAEIRKAEMGDGMSKAVEFAHEEDSFLSESPRSNSSTRSITSPSDTLIIFDWDDTLLCSSALASSQWTKELLEQLERAVDNVLCLAMELGETKIITNGNATWVQDSSRRFLPGLVSKLEELEVMSARAAFEDAYPGDPFSWKRAAFNQVLELWHGEGVQRKLNLVVLGDSPAEMEAAHYASQVYKGPVLVKTVKFREAPSPQQLIGQLNRLSRELRSIVMNTNNDSKRLEQRKAPMSVAQAATWVSNWRLVPGRDWSKPASFADQLLGDVEDHAPLPVALETPAWMLLLGEKLNTWTKAQLLKK